MTAVVDIRCPECDRVESVVKLALDRYRCTDCEAEFAPGDVVP